MATPSTSKREVQVTGATGAVFSFTTWVLSRYLFRGALPSEVTGLLYFVVPYCMGVVAGYLARRRRLRAERDAAYIRSLRRPTGNP